MPPKSFTKIISPKDVLSERSMSKKCDSCNSIYTHTHFSMTKGSKGRTPGIFRSNSCKSCEVKTPFPRVSLYALKEEVSTLKDAIDELEDKIEFLEEKMVKLALLLEN